MRKGDLNSKLRIQYYKHIATNWMPAAGVDVLAMSTLDVAMLPRRHHCAERPCRAQIASYSVNGCEIQRPTFPEPPPGFVWSDHRLPRKKRSSTDPLLASGTAKDDADVKQPKESGENEQSGIRKRGTKRKRVVLSIAPAGTGLIKLEKFVRCKVSQKISTPDSAALAHEQVARKIIRRAKSFLKRKRSKATDANHLDAPLPTSPQRRCVLKTADVDDLDDNENLVSDDPWDVVLLSENSVPSAAGGMADRCEHLSTGLRCNQEAYAVCEFCQVVLCNVHFNNSRCHEHNTFTFCPCMECTQNGL